MFKSTSNATFLSVTALGIKISQFLNIMNSFILLSHFVRVYQSKYIACFVQINNAGASCVEVDKEGLKALNVDPATWVSLNFC